MFCARKCLATSIVQVIVDISKQFELRSSWWQRVVYTTIVDLKKKREKKKIFKFDKLNFEGCWDNLGGYCYFLPVPF